MGVVDKGWPMMLTKERFRGTDTYYVGPRLPTDNFPQITVNGRLFCVKEWLTMHGEVHPMSDDVVCVVCGHCEEHCECPV